MTDTGFDINLLCKVDSSSRNELNSYSAVHQFQFLIQTGYRLGYTLHSTVVSI